jgi:two-component system phosphate regulon sensor histidine kinase PhoR/two-component system sensor histidine kinase VicK
MAVKVSEFFKRYHSDTIAFFVLLQVLVILVAGTVGWYIITRLGLPLLESYMLSLAVLMLLELLAGVAFLTSNGKPLKILAQAIAHVSSDPIQTPPPTLHPSQTHNGLRELVQTIYELAASAGRTAAGASAIPTDHSMADILFQNAPCGIIGLNEAGVVVTNTQAPTHTNSQNEIELELLFEQSDSLNTWLKDCRANKVRDTKVWRRVADSVPGEDGRRIFDVIGYYNKQGLQNLEVILITIDRTAEYAPDDEDMDFIALAAHELRGPITIIRGYLDLLDDELQQTLKPDQQVLIDRLQVSAEQLSGYISNILNVSRYDRNHLKLHLHEDTLLDIIKTLIPDLALRAKTKNRRLTFHIPPDLPTIAADRSSMSEVLSNLIDNAIKYSHDNGEIIIRAAIKGNFVEVTLQDFGIGMPGSVMGNLFTKFYRSHRSRQQVSGTGLGLYICKAIVESHGGTIWVRSVEGQGSTFGFTIPIYATVAEKLANGDNNNEQIIERADGWIKNHAMYRR